MLRKAFEKWISLPPLEKEVIRWPNDESKYAWPGRYKDIDVALAWLACKEFSGAGLNVLKEATRMELLKRLPNEELKRYLVCGGRDYHNRKFLNTKLKILLETDWMFILVHGDARGADTLAKEWGKAVEVIVEPYPADWAMYGKAAGTIRNQEMLDSRIDGVIAFKGGTGTADMVARAIKAGVPVWDLRDELGV